MKHLEGGRFRAPIQKGGFILPFRVEASPSIPPRKQVRLLNPQPGE